MLEPLGQSQVLAYLEGLAGDFSLHLVSFEKVADWADEAGRKLIQFRLKEAGITWHPLRYHKSPTVPATGFDIAQGAAAALAIAMRHKIRLVHARSYIPALIGRQVQRLTGAKLLFDMRGFWADERVDGGLWPAGGRLYRSAKALERSLLRAADGVVTLTEAAAAEIRGLPYLTDRAVDLRVIPTCADLYRFRPQPALRAPQLTFGYVGAVGTWHRFDDVLRSFLLLREKRPEARLLVVNRNEHGLIRAACERLGVPAAATEIRAADFADMPQQVARMHMSSALRLSSYSQLGCAPTKLAEYLGCGVPCFGNTGVGDFARIVERERVGVAVADFGEKALAEGVERMLALCAEPNIIERCVSAAHRHFALDAGIEAYRMLYADLLAGDRR